MKQSVQNRLLLEPYKGERKIEASVKSGFASVKQRSTLIGLKLLADALVFEINSKETTRLKAGSIVYFEETQLASSPWSKQTYSAAGLMDGEFVLGDYNHAIAVVEGK